MGFTPSSVPNLVAARQMYAEWMQSQNPVPLPAVWEGRQLHHDGLPLSPWVAHPLGGLEVQRSDSILQRSQGIWFHRLCGAGGRWEDHSLWGSFWERLKCGKSFGCFGCFGGSVGNHMNNPNIISKHCKKAFMFLTNMCFSTMASNQIPCSSWQ